MKAFSLAIDVPTPFAVTNQAALGSINRSQGATVTWTGGFPNGEILVAGGSPGPMGSVNFSCYGWSDSGQLTIPPSILLALPPGFGKLTVLNLTSPQKVPGVTFSLAAAIVSYDISSTLN